MFFQKKPKITIPAPKSDILQCKACKDCVSMKSGLYCKRSLKEVQAGTRKSVLAVTYDTECHYVKEGID